MENHIQTYDRGVVCNAEQFISIQAQPGQEIQPDRVSYLNEIITVKEVTMVLYPVLIIVMIIVRIIMAVNEIIKQNIANKPAKPLRIRNATNIIANNFIDAKQLFVKLNKQLPNVLLINGIDVNKAISMIEDRLSNNIQAVYKHKQFDFDAQCSLFNMIIIVTHDRKIIEIGNGYIELLYTADYLNWADFLAKDIAQFQVQMPVQAATRNICITGFAGRMN